MKVELVMVEWVDIETYGGWVEPSDVEALFNGKKPPCLCITVGFKVAENESSLFVAGSFNRSQWGDVTIVPKAIIRKVDVLKEWPLDD